MTPLSRRAILFALSFCMAPSAWGQQYLLYTPQPAPTGQKAAAQDGILVQEIEIQKGDTLYALSRKFSGRGTYFPQILLFNSIKNPNLIYAGDTLKVPLAQREAAASDSLDAKPAGGSPRPRAAENRKPHAKAAKHPAARRPDVPSSVSAPSTELSLSDLKAGGTGKNRVSLSKKKDPVIAKKNQKHTSQSGTMAASPSTAVQKSATAPVSAADAVAGQKLFEAAVKAYRQDDCLAAMELLDRYLADNPVSPLAADANLYKAECYLKMSAQ